MPMLEDMEGRLEEITSRIPGLKSKSPGQPAPAPSSLAPSDIFLQRLRERMRERSQESAPTPTSTPVQPAPTPTSTPVQPAPTPTSTPVQPAPTPTSTPVQPAPTPTSTPVQPAPTPTSTPVQPAPTPTSTPVQPAPTPTSTPVQPAPAPSSLAPSDIFLQRLRERMRERSQESSPTPTSTPVQPAPTPTSTPVQPAPTPTSTPVQPAPTPTNPIEQAKKWYMEEGHKVIKDYLGVTGDNEEQAWEAIRRGENPNPGKISEAELKALRGLDALNRNPDANPDAILFFAKQKLGDKNVLNPGLTVDDVNKVLEPSLKGQYTPDNPGAQGPRVGLDGKLLPPGQPAPTPTPGQPAPTPTPGQPAPTPTPGQPAPTPTPGHLSGLPAPSPGLLPSEDTGLLPGTEPDTPPTEYKGVDYKTQVGEPALIKEGDLTTEAVKATPVLAKIEQAVFNPETMTAEGRISAMLSRDSAYMRRAAESGLLAAVARGLGNSSFAAGSAMAAAIDKAAPIALQDAQIAAQFEQFNTEQANQINSLNAQLETAVNQGNAQEVNRLNQQLNDLEARRRDTNAKLLHDSQMLQVQINHEIAKAIMTTEMQKDLAILGHKQEMDMSSLRHRQELGKLKTVHGFELDRERIRHEQQVNRDRVNQEHASEMARINAEHAKLIQDDAQAAAIWQRYMDYLVSLSANPDLSVDEVLALRETALRDVEAALKFVSGIAS